MSADNKYSFHAKCKKKLTYRQLQIKILHFQNTKTLNVILKSVLPCSIVSLCPFETKIYLTFVEKKNTYQGVPAL